MRGSRYFARFTPRAVVAPKIIIVEWNQALTHGDNARPRCIERHRFNQCAIHAGLPDGRLRSYGKSTHVIRMPLRRVNRIALFSEQWVFRSRRSDYPFLAIHNGNAHAQRPEIHTCYQCHALIL